MPMVMVPVPKALALTVPLSVPASMTVPVENVLTPESVSPEVELFCTTPVTLVPITALISELPEPVPELVMVPILLTALVDTVMPLTILLLLFKMRLPAVFATPPERVSSAAPLLLLLVSVVFVALAVS